MVRKYAVDLFFDVVCPYSYIMFESLLRYRSKWPMSVALKPFSLADVMKETGNPSPLEAVPIKKAYLAKEAMLLAKYHNIPYSLGKVDVFFQFLLLYKFYNLSIDSMKSQDACEILTNCTPIYANRLICATQIVYPEKAESVTRAIFRRMFVEKAGISEPNDLLEVMHSCGIDGKSLPAHDATEKLRGNTEEAIETGCFGAPWTIVTAQDGKEETFFGSDRLQLIGLFMGQRIEGPYPAQAQFFDYSRMQKDPPKQLQYPREEMRQEEIDFKSAHFRLDPIILPHLNKEKPAKLQYPH
ncbi:hypothetical protein PMAYCL1PPCAC_14784 [Pristionchus mayeri]|uniref:DSBA-like thioredoxin domain-containing protein n=1 Tax=Pristionchus mayeri TaxID=1317129 RepID=A0AAN5CHN3_9BILA|nr:hypothetical protein PMAYCL1PPCAC_14784 [Pristionchus mayeri]